MVTFYSLHIDGFDDFVLKGVQFVAHMTADIQTFNINFSYSLTSD